MFPTPLAARRRRRLCPRQERLHFAFSSRADALLVLKLTQIRRRLEQNLTQRQNLNLLFVGDFDVDELTVTVPITRASVTTPAHVPLRRLQRLTF